VIGAAESDVALVAVGAAVPERVLTNDEISLRVETDDAWIRERTGIVERRVVGPGETVTTLAIAAAQQAVDRADIAPAEIDLVLVATASPERSFPSIAALVADAVGAHSAGGIDLLAACAGFAYGLGMAIAQIQAGFAQTVLVVGSETLSEITDWTDRSTCILFGDGAGAVIVRAGGAPDREQVVVELGVDGSHGDDLVSEIRPRIGADVADPMIRMNGNAVYRFATHIIVDSAERVLERGGYGRDDIDLFVPHQANRRIIESGCERLGFPLERVLIMLDRYGNTSSASIPLCLDDAWRSGRLRHGQRLLMMGLGGGLSWGTCLIRWMGEPA
jgi:3-oxoacyl-[acyl-carrier-protein] synthase-3